MSPPLPETRKTATASARDGPSAGDQGANHQGANTHTEVPNGSSKQEHTRRKGTGKETKPRTQPEKQGSTQAEGRQQTVRTQERGQAPDFFRLVRRMMAPSSPLQASHNYQQRHRAFYTRPRVTPGLIPAPSSFMGRRETANDSTSLSTAMAVKSRLRTHALWGVLRQGKALR